MLWIIDHMWSQGKVSVVNLAVQGLYSLKGKTSYCQISWNLETARLNVIMIDRIALKIDRHLGIAAAKQIVKFQSYLKSQNPNLEASRLHEIWR